MIELVRLLERRLKAVASQGLVVAQMG